MFEILVGSTRPAKAEAARAAIDAIAVIDERFRRTTFKLFDVTSVAPTMPMTERAILDGARIRAQALIDRAVVAGLSEFPLAIGAEGGLDPLPSDSALYALKTWAAVTDGARWGYGAGGAIVLPDTLTRQVLAGRELGEVIDEVAGAPVRGTRGAWGVLTLDLVGRRDSFTPLSSPPSRRFTIPRFTKSELSGPSSDGRESAVDGELDGLRLIGFAVWGARGGPTGPALVLHTTDECRTTYGLPCPDRRSRV